MTDMETLAATIAKIDNAPNGKRRGHGAAFRSDSTKAHYLARGERIVGVVGGFAHSAIHMPARSRGPNQPEQICFYGASGVCISSQPVTTENLAWFDAAFARAA